MIALLRRWLARVRAAEAVAWLEPEIERQRAASMSASWPSRSASPAASSGAPSWACPAEDIAAAQTFARGMAAAIWAPDEAARVALLLATHRGDDEAFAARVDRLCVTAEVTEHVAYLKGFAVFPAGRSAARARARRRALVDRRRCSRRSPATTRIRSTISTRRAWNQMVVKCVFVGAPIDTIVGLDERRNAELLVMLRDFVAERHAAGRPLPKDVHDFLAE